MPIVFNSTRSQFSLLLTKATLAILPILTLATLVIASGHSDLQPTVTPVLASSERESEPELQRAVGDDDTVKYATPDDTFAQQQWNLQSSPSIAGASGLFSSQEFLTGALDVVVAVVDSGVILQHEDLNFLPGYDFIHNPIVGNDGDGRDHDPSDPGDWVDNEDISQQTVSNGCPVAASKWHGTAISGIIGATGYNATGIAGGSPFVSMLPVRVTGKCGGYVADLIDGIRWSAGLNVDGVADNQYPADVINLSVGFPGSCSNAMQQAINDATNAGAVVVTAATNSAVNLDQEPYSPASCDNVLTIAATDRDGAITQYTALGESVFLSAPGGTATDGIITTQNEGLDLPVPGSSYGYHYGTSIAAAHVSSTVANLLAYQPGLTLEQIKQLLSVSAESTDFDPHCRSGQCGEGRLNAYAAMELLAVNYLQDDEHSAPETENLVPVQLAAANSITAAPAASLVNSATDDDDEDIRAGSIDLANFLILLLIPLLQRRFRPHRQA